MSLTVATLTRDLVDARRIATARAVFDEGRGALSARHAPTAATQEWVTEVLAVHTSRGGGRGATSFIAHAAGVAPSTILRLLRDRGRSAT